MRLNHDFFVYLTVMTDCSSSVPPSCWWWITCTDHFLYTEWHSLSILWVERPRYTIGAQGYCEKIFDCVERRGATTEYYNTPSRKRGDSVIETNIWKKANNNSQCKLVCLNFIIKEQLVPDDFSEQMVFHWDLTMSCKDSMWFKQKAQKKQSSRGS